MRDHEEEFNSLKVKIIVVTFEPGPSAKRYAEETGLPWPVVIDETRELYRGYGMLSASFWDIWGPATWRAYLKGMLKGGKIRPSKADIRQRGGDVLIGPDGIVRMHHVAKGPADRPGIDRILHIIHEWNAKRTGKAP